MQTARQTMIDRQLRARGVTSKAVLNAMARVPRERFVPENLRRHAYDDCALPIGAGQTISQPYIVALMTQSLDLAGGEMVLEVGTGSGYQTAVLSLLASRVISIERHEELSRSAGDVLAELGCENVELIVGDGSLGWPDEAPYDRILVAAAADHCPPALLDQLAEGGVLVIPIGDPEAQQLLSIRKSGGRLQTTRLTDCRFVPLVED